MARSGRSRSAVSGCQHLQGHEPCPLLCVGMLCSAGSLRSLCCRTLSSGSSRRPVRLGLGTRQGWAACRGHTRFLSPGQCARAAGAAASSTETGRCRPTTSGTGFYMSRKSEHCQGSCGGSWVGSSGKPGGLLGGGCAVCRRAGLLGEARWASAEGPAVCPGALSQASPWRPVSPTGPQPCCWLGWRGGLLCQQPGGPSAASVAALCPAFRPLSYLCFESSKSGSSKRNKVIRLVDITDIQKVGACPHPRLPLGAAAPPPQCPLGALSSGAGGEHPARQSGPAVGCPIC